MPEVVQARILEPRSVTQDWPEIFNGAPADRIGGVLAVADIRADAFQRVEVGQRWTAKHLGASARLRIWQSHAAMLEVDPDPSQADDFPEPHASVGQQPHRANAADRCPALSLNRRKSHSDLPQLCRGEKSLTPCLGKLGDALRWIVAPQFPI